MTIRVGGPGRGLIVGLAIALFAAASLTAQAQASARAGAAPATVTVPAADVVCGERRSTRIDFTVRNYLSVPVTLRSSEVDCSDWSNTGNPTNANDVQVAATGRYGWALELARNATARWRLTVDGGPGVGKGSVPLRLRLGGVVNASGADLRVAGGTKEQVGREICYSKRIAPTSEPASPPIPASDRVQRSSLQIFSDGSHIVVRACSDVIFNGL